jgi:hypothetical protein
VIVAGSWERLPERRLARAEFPASPVVAIAEASTSGLEPAEAEVTTGPLHPRPLVVRAAPRAATDDSVVLPSAGVAVAAAGPGPNADAADAKAAEAAGGSVAGRPVAGPETEAEPATVRSALAATTRGTGTVAAAEASASSWATEFAPAPAGELVPGPAPAVAAPSVPPVAAAAAGAEAVLSGAVPAPA